MEKALKDESGYGEHPQNNTGLWLCCGPQWCPNRAIPLVNQGPKETDHFLEKDIWLTTWVCSTPATFPKTTRSPTWQTKRYSWIWRTANRDILSSSMWGCGSRCISCSRLVGKTSKTLKAWRRRLWRSTFTTSSAKSRYSPSRRRYLVTGLMYCAPRAFGLSIAPFSGDTTASSWATHSVNFEH